MKLVFFIRSLVAALLFPFTIILLGPIAIGGHYLFSSRKFDDYLMRLWGKICCRMSGVNVILENEDKIPKGGCLFLFTHTSFFDVFAMAGYINGLRFGAKAELYKIPILSLAMKALGTLPIARNNREKVFKIYEEAKERFSHGEKFALSPEGGRFYNPKHLSPFKAGPFIFAMSAGAPLVPIVIIGAYEALPKGSFLFNSKKWSHTVRIIVLDPVETSDFSEDQRRDLQKLVYERMNSVWVEEMSKLH
jgi:1-acyl-sn-glycerol-3-phosphate acyltransferase